MDQIKDAFQKVKTDIDSLYNKFDSLRSELNETRQEIVNVCGILEEINKKVTEKEPKKTSTHQSQKSTTSTHPSTHHYPLEPLKTQNLAFSIGNEGVSTDRQTDRQTHNRQENVQKIDENSQNSIENAAKILDSLDAIKKDIRLKFKRLTEQELLVFSTLYQINNETGPTDYKTLSTRLNLTESSIRDYIGRLIKKGIPVDKKRVNNKTIHLSVSESLQKVASLSTILQLRGL